MNYNKAQLIGRLTRDPELKALPNGNTKIASFSIATTRTWLDQNKAKQEATDFHNLVAFGKQAETIAQYVKKGHLLFVEGRMQTRSWDDKDTGKKMYRTEIVVENFIFAPKAANAGAGEYHEEARPEGAPPRGQYAKGKKKAATTRTSSAADVDPIEYPSDDINAEDIPF